MVDFPKVAQSETSQSEGYLYYYYAGVFTADKFSIAIFASDIFIQAKLQSGVFTAGGITEWSFLVLYY